jgi:hypothetical protein
MKDKNTSSVDTMKKPATSNSIILMTVPTLEINIDTFLIQFQISVNVASTLIQTVEND